MQHPDQAPETAAQAVQCSTAFADNTEVHSGFRELLELRVMPAKRYGEPLRPGLQVQYLFYGSDLTRNFPHSVVWRSRRFIAVLVSYLLVVGGSCVVQLQSHWSRTPASDGPQDRQFNRSDELSGSFFGDFLLLFLSPFNLRV